MRFQVYLVHVFAKEKKNQPPFQQDYENRRQRSWRSPVDATIFFELQCRFVGGAVACPCPFAKKRKQNINNDARNRGIRRPSSSWRR